VLLLDDLTSTDRDLQVQSLAHGVIALDQVDRHYGGARRRLRVLKFRGSSFRSGYHDYVIRRGGVQVFPRLVAMEHRQPASLEKLSSGIAELDALMGGGVERGTSTLIVGAAGTGKSTLAAQFVAAAMARNQSASMFIFDESETTLITRCTALGIDLRPAVEAGRLQIQPVDPSEFSPGELVQRIRAAVEERQVAIVVLDSLNGYLNAMAEEHFLIIQLHELLSYLGHSGVATLLIGAHQGLIGMQMQSPVDATYLADAVVLLRYFEARGEVRQALSVVKKRGGTHERTIREFSLAEGRLRIGDTLRNMRGVLTGVPTPEPGDASR
jgi:circadian clock protein KaiC